MAWNWFIPFGTKRDRVRRACEHEWKIRRFYGDERLHRNGMGEKYCVKCGKIGKMLKTLAEVTE